MPQRIFFPCHRERAEYLRGRLHGRQEQQTEDRGRGETNGSHGVLLKSLLPEQLLEARQAIPDRGVVVDERGHARTLTLECASQARVL